MKRQLLILLTMILAVNLHAQVEFEKGYYINNNNQKKECLIKNIDWKNNPSEIIYRLSENDNEEKLTIELVKEFGIYDKIKFKRFTVNIDRSSDVTNYLSNKRNPIFKKEQLFLESLVEGKANLYVYVDASLRRYFYSKDKSDIEQLIYKKYKAEHGRIAVNNRFRQQLWTDLACKDLQNKIENVDYRKKELLKFFVDYNNCVSSDISYLKTEPKRDWFNLSIRPRLNISSLTINNPEFTLINEKVDFGNKVSFGLGLEAEIILPFNNDKWSFTVEPSYQSYKGKGAVDASNVVGNKLYFDVDYKSLEVPIGLRYYFFLNKDSKIFTNLVYEFDFGLNSSVEITRPDGNKFNSLDIKSQKNLAFGVGYKFMDKLSVEARWHIKRDFLSDYVYWVSNYNYYSLIFGYTLF